MLPLLYSNLSLCLVQFLTQVDSMIHPSRTVVPHQWCRILDIAISTTEVHTLSIGQFGHKVSGKYKVALYSSITSLGLEFQKSELEIIQI